MNLVQLIEQLKTNPNVTHWQTQPAQPAQYAPWPQGLAPQIIEALKRQGIDQLYTHQAEAVSAALNKEHTVVVTPTASGKTLCYNLPVLNTILDDDSARALYLFPTKALAQDQVITLQELGRGLGAEIKTYTYDGDTPANVRQVIRQAGHIVVTNPDMLHTGILPHHTKWVKLFENLHYVVIDELHQYRGVFGSHLANLIRRLRRICQFYGSDPIFLSSSATIANPKELAEKLINAPAKLIDNNGAPTGEKHFAFYNPPVVNHELGIRRSSLLEAEKLAANLIKNEIQTIVFARSRLNVEVLLSYLQKKAKNVAGYRGGYLPNQRRTIERGLREGTIRGVVSTNALELGIDIGQLEACVMAGYPGSIASSWQQAGRAGRRNTTSLAVLVASSAPLDQYVIQHPDYFFNKAPEHGLINPDNLLILVSHLKCAAFELPFTEDERFGPPTTQEILAYLEEEQLLRRAGGKWHWSAENFPAEEISLRSAASENVVIIDQSQTGRPRVIGEMDPLAAMTMLHDQAIYLHAGETYHVDKLDWAEKKAYIHKVTIDYYTDAELAVTIKVLDVIKNEGNRNFGEVLTTALPTIYKKIKFGTHENVGWGKISLPEYQMHTAAYWLSLPPALTDGWSQDELQSALVALANLLMGAAPVYLMCDPKDIRAVPQVRSPFTEEPTIYIYDAYPGGIGLGERLYYLQPQLLQAAFDLLSGCPCEGGCPSCVGPLNEVGEKGKQGALKLLKGAMALEPA